MPAASGINKQVAYKKETAYGVLPVAAGAQLLRRVDAVFNLVKETYESNEMRTDFQTADMRHGVRSVNGSINGELSPGSYAPLIGSVVKRDFAAIAPITALGITIAVDGSAWTITRAAGSWITGGIKVGQVGRLTAGTFNAANLNKNLFVVAVTALALTVIPLNGAALVAEGPITGATWTVPGKYTYIPQTGHTDDSYAVEEWFTDITRGETFVGFKPAQVSIKLPPSGMATIGITGAGKDLGQPPSGTRYFTSPTAASSTPVFAAVNGVLTIDGVRQLAITGLDFDIASTYSGDGVVGSNVKPYQFAEGVKVSGSFTAYFEDGTLPAAFYDETAVGIAAAFSTDNSAAAEFQTFSLSRVKVGGAEKGDAKGGVIRTYPFTALLNTAGGAAAAHELTTIAIQDSLA